MKKRTFVMAISLFLIMCVGMLSGCGKREPMSIVFVVGNHANSKELPVNDVDTYNLISKVMDNEAGGTFSVIELDGSPYEVVSGKIPEINSTYSETRKNSMKAQNIEVLYQAFNMAVPKTPEVDVLKALTMAGKRAESMEGEKQIVMIDNGILTTGMIDAKTMFSADESWIVEQLREKNSLPNLEGIELTWVGLGNLSAGSQKDLPESAQRELRDKWEAIIEAAGGHVEFVPVLSALERSNEDAMPSVTGIDPPKQEIIHLEESNTIDLDKTTVISENMLMFEPDSAELKQTKTSDKVISDIASAMEKSSETKILIAGSVAGDSESAWGEELSKMRAETVKSLLVAAGIEQDRIKTIGLSIHSPWRIDGLGVGPEAAPNRHVVIINQASETAMELLE
ncbi:MAG: OmpA family protein [Bacillota bacterium]|nr:OmpA family protein [Bacillota bacterium]